ncbi:hypothetical protein BaRGS_00032573 [Batillaria attramentaria]|uniref:Uncharacterized protein n=1 Tax=Batillaria attramentaria TaxID=370345 RepID=A0ABD0JMZ9_9CAEN
MCCGDTAGGTCDDTPDNWVAAPITGSDASHVTASYDGCGTGRSLGLRYEWRTSPCEFKNCTLYDWISDLPAPPYITLDIPL